MDMDEDDDFYGDGENNGSSEAQAEEAAAAVEPVPKSEAIEQDLEDGEEEDEEEEDDSDIDIITERKDGTKAAPPSTARYNEIRNIPQRTGSSDIITKPAVVKQESTPKPSIATDPTGADLPGLATSTIDVNAKPEYEPAGKPITQVNIDVDLAEHAKPWRQPGTDITDFFNFGFDEFTWALYASKQDQIRGEYDQDKIAMNQKKMMEDMNMMMMGGGMPMPGGMGGMPAGAGGLDGMPPEMQAMMQQMMSQGVDPSQMDPQAMFSAMQGGGQAGAQGFGGQQGFGQQGWGNDQNMGGAGRGNFRGRGRGYRNW